MSWKNMFNTFWHGMHTMTKTLFVLFIFICNTVKKFTLNLSNIIQNKIYRKHSRKCVHLYMLQMFCGLKEANGNHMFLVMKLKLSLRKFDGRHPDWLTVTVCLCHKWWRMCSVCSNHNPVLSSSLTNHQ